MNKAVMDGTLAFSLSAWMPHTTYLRPLGFALFTLLVPWSPVRNVMLFYLIQSDDHW